MALLLRSLQICDEPWTDATEAIAKAVEAKVTATTTRENVEAAHAHEAAHGTARLKVLDFLLLFHCFSTILIYSHNFLVNILLRLLVWTGVYHLCTSDGLIALLGSSYMHRALRRFLNACD